MRTGSKLSAAAVNLLYLTVQLMEETWSLHYHGWLQIQRLFRSLGATCSPAMTAMIEFLRHLMGLVTRLATLEIVRQLALP